MLPSEQLTEVADVVRETLIGAESSRLLTALAPVLVQNIDRLNLPKLHAQLVEMGLQRRHPQSGHPGRSDGDGF